MKQRLSISLYWLYQKVWRRVSLLNPPHRNILLRYEVAGWWVHYCATIPLPFLTNKTQFPTLYINVGYSTFFEGTRPRRSRVAYKKSVYLSTNLAGLVQSGEITPEPLSLLSQPTKNYTELDWKFLFLETADKHFNTKLRN